jgi:urease accessory protein
MLRRAIRILPAGTWAEADADRTVTLNHADRFRRRVQLHDDAGEPFLLDLPRAVQFGDGDGLALDVGGMLRVVAAAERLAEVRARSAEELARLAWHLGNRHQAVQVVVGAIRLPWDHVLVDMLAGLGAVVTAVDAPFSPESGAYGGAGGHGHGGHDHGHDHRHGHQDHAHDYDLGPVHDHGC